MHVHIHDEKSFDANLTHVYLYDMNSYNANPTHVQFYNGKTASLH